jgi:hypothetical protein
MAHNPSPKAVSEQLDLGDHVGKGIHNQGAALGLLQYTDANYPPLVVALEQKQSVFNAKRSLLVDAFVPYAASIAAIRKACLDARKLLSISLGEAYSQAWAAPGWTNNTTEVPKVAADLVALAKDLKQFLTDNSDFEVTTAKVTFTALNFATLLDNYDSADSGVTEARTALNTAGTDRRASSKALLDAIRGVIEFLEKKLGPNDSLWEEFGLNRPGASSTPVQASIASVAQAGTGTVVATANAVTGATYYRWKAKLVGVDASFRFLGRTKDPLLQLTAQPASGTLQIVCEAANEAGPGKASAPASISLS